MGLVINVERWDMSAAIGMATEGIRAKYNYGAGGGGFGGADIEIGSKLDGAKVLAAIERMASKAQHLADWSLFAYASPLWNSTDNKTRLFESALNDWVVASAEQGIMIQKRTYERVQALIPVVAGGLALEQIGGAQTCQNIDGVKYSPSLTRSYLIHILVEVDCLDKQETRESFKKKRIRFYQNHWADWDKHIQSIRTIFITYDKSARKMFKYYLISKTSSHP